jgi:hypothetical protein
VVVILPNGLDLGVSGIKAGLGDHICGLYSGEFQREVGDILDPASTIAQAGLGNGDIFTVERA